MSNPRIIEVHRTNFTVRDGDNDITAVVRGNFHETKEFPKVGDYVGLSSIDGKQAVIESIKPRSSVIKRKSGDTEEEQIIATNVDVIFIVMGMDKDFNVSRLERYLLLSAQSGIKPVIILNKIDIADDVDEKLKLVSAIAENVPILLVSALLGVGMEDVNKYIDSDTTAVLLGSSGAGKSTITNYLLRDDIQDVQSIREDDSRGRHTTTSRQLFSLPSRGYLIDTPGMRELGVVEVDTRDESEVFSKIESLASDCKFRNCDHEKSSGCAVLQALDSGYLSERELSNYQKLIRGRQYNESKYTSSQIKYKEQIIKRKKQYEAAQNRKRLSSR